MVQRSYQLIARFLSVAKIVRTIGESDLNFLSIIEKTVRKETQEKELIINGTQYDHRISISYSVIQKSLKKGSVRGMLWKRIVSLVSLIYRRGMRF